MIGASVVALGLGLVLVHTAPPSVPSAPVLLPPAKQPATKPVTKPNDEPAAKPSAMPSASGATRGEVAISATWTETRPDDSEDPDTPLERGVEQIGRLLLSKVDIEVDDARVSDVLRVLRRKLGLNTLVFELDPRVHTLSQGVDGERRITMSLYEVDGRTALESVLSLAGEHLTWQIHNGVVEIGPKAHLAREQAQRVEEYDITAISVNIPKFRFEGHEVRGRRLSERDQSTLTGELMRLISNTCEPEAWSPAPVRLQTRPDGTLIPVPPPVAPTIGGKNLMASLNFDADAGPLFVNGQWATMQASGGLITVRAPDFVHRRIMGYGQMLAPKAGGRTLEKVDLEALERQEAAEKSTAPQKRK